MVWMVVKTAAENWMICRTEAGSMVAGRKEAEAGLQC